ncbi:20394_t:CDS:2 [Gigaspora margarita]|uniref:20394_t:CDS:1 n=1 Tax=Gigaspora margarita TaxID=4874 RepID=A0ABM8W334_GIGMA|nr:20394_t:CDS:2 [Gigaspora margarita]
MLEMKIINFCVLFLFITWISVANSYPRKVDPCANIYNDHKSGKPSFKYEDVKACYESFPFDKNNATLTIETLKSILGSFYSFLDQAKDPPTKGFTYKSIDLLSELDSLLKNDYKTNIQFMYDIYDTVRTLKDAHTKHQIKVFNDSIHKNNIDCQVTHIDDEPAMDVIVKFANESIRTSRDLGVRFNNALASLTLQSGKIRLDSFSQQFTYRALLPKNPTISYTLDCDGKINKITRGWKITAHNESIFNNFTDSASYWSNVCINQPLQARSGLSYESKRELDEYEPTLEEGKLIINAHIIRFYTLRDFGVAVISTEVFDISNGLLLLDLLSTINQGFQSFVNMGIKKVVLDLTNNGGGFVRIAHFITQLLFRNIRNFPFDIKVTDAAKLVTEQSTLKNTSTEFDINRHYISEKTNTLFANVSDFIGNNYYIRGGLKIRYSNKGFNSDEEIIRELLGNISNPLPWTAENLIILTNGFCGSACAHITQRFAEINVKTVAVGGFSNVPLSFACFAGGFVITSDTFFNYLKNLTLLDNPLMPKQFPLATTISFTVNEAYSIKNPNEILEFSFRPANYRLYYDEKSIRDPSKLWVQAAAFLENKH